jgi:subtilisin
VPAVWAQGFTGKGVIVGHLDTGIDASHPVFSNDAVERFAAFDGLGRQIPQTAASDSGEHGTHTAGILAGRPISRQRIGVAPDCRLASAMVIEGGDVTARVLGGMDWALGNGARILSMSLGLRGWHAQFQALITTRVRKRGVLPIIAIGNEGPGFSRSPGNYSDAFSVGAVDANDTVSEFSSSQRFDRRMTPVVPRLVAPGVDILSAVPGGMYARMSGTSMATPHVAGLAALLLQANPETGVEALENAILESARRPKGMPEERGGMGVPDVETALKIIVKN